MSRRSVWIQQAVPCDFATFAPLRQSVSASSNSLSARATRQQLGIAASPVHLLRASRLERGVGYRDVRGRTDGEPLWQLLIDTFASVDAPGTSYRRGGDDHGPSRIVGHRHRRRIRIRSRSRPSRRARPRTGAARHADRPGGARTTDGEAGRFSAGVATATDGLIDCRLRRHLLSRWTWSNHVPRHGCATAVAVGGVARRGGSL